MAALESLFYCDYSLSIKAGVHFTLCGGTICKLGTKKHHDAYLDRMDTLDLPGSFSMTELGERTVGGRGEGRRGEGCDEALCLTGPSLAEQSLAGLLHFCCFCSCWCAAVASLPPPPPPTSSSSHTLNPTSSQATAPT